MTEIGDEGLLAPASRSEQGEGVARLRKSAARKSPSIIASAELQEPAEDKMVSIPKLDALDPSMALKKKKKKGKGKRDVDLRSLHNREFLSHQFIKKLWRVVCKLDGIKGKLVLQEQTKKCAICLLILAKLTHQMGIRSLTQHTPLRRKQPAKQKSLKVS